MNRTLRSFKYFSESTTPPFFEVFEVINDKKHPQYTNLIADFESFPKSDFNSYTKKYHIENKLSDSQDKEIGKIAYFMVHILSNAIFEKRINELLKEENRPAPYNSDNLVQLSLEKNNLTFIKNFDLSNRRLEFNDQVYQITPSIFAENSSYWLSNVILNSAIKLDLNFKIRLHPFIEIASSNYSAMEYKMNVYGKPLDWKKLLNLKNEDFGQWFDEMDYNRNGITDYVWAPKKNNEIHFTCEELPKPQNKYLVSRYFHSIFNQETGEIKHCDGAIRIYDKQELQNRSKFHIRNSEVRKIGKRIKIFQYDSKDNDGRELTKEIFSLLAVNFFVWNEDVVNYFN